MPPFDPTSARPVSSTQPAFDPSSARPISSTDGEVPATGAETVSDVARSLPTGVHQGAAAIPGMFGDAQELGRQLAGVPQYWILRAMGRSDEDARAEVQRVHDVARGIAEADHIEFPTSQEVNNAALSVESPAVREFTNHTPTTQAGEFARTIGQMAPAALAPGSAVQRIARVVVPGVTSEAAGELTHGTPIEPVARFVGALAGAGISEGTIGFLTRQGLTPDQRALRLISRELSNAGYSPDQIVRVANKLTAQAPTEEIMAELMGPSGLRLARATAAMGEGAGRSVATDTLNARATGRPGPTTSTNPNTPRGVTSIADRVMGEATRALAPEQTRSPTNYWDFLDTLRSARAGQAADNYATAYAAPIDQDLAQQHLLPLMREAPDAAKSGARQLDSEVQRLIGQRSQMTLPGRPAPDPSALATLDANISDARGAAVQLRAIAGGQPPNSIGARAIDYFQRGLQQAEQTAGHGSPEAGALGNFRRGFNGLADQIAPALGDTRSNYGSSMRIEDMTQLGRNVFKMSDGELERAMRGPNGSPLTTEEFDGFQLGVLDAVENKLGQGDTGFLARLARNKNWQAQLARATGGPTEARRFMTRLAREASMQRTRNAVLSGSQTTPIAEDIKALTEGESELSFMNDHVRGLIQSGGNWRQLALRLATGIYDRVRRPGIANPQVQDAMARRLFAQVTRKGSQELRDALMQVRNDPGVDPTMRRWLNRYVAVNSAASHSRGTDQSLGADTPRSLGAGYGEEAPPPRRLGQP